MRGPIMAAVVNGDSGVSRLVLCSHQRKERERADGQGGGKRTSSRTCSYTLWSLS